MSLFIAAALALSATAFVFAKDLIEARDGTGPLSRSPLTLTYTYRAQSLFARLHEPETTPGLRGFAAYTALVEAVHRAPGNPATWAQLAYTAPLAVADGGDRIDGYLTRSYEIAPTDKDAALIRIPFALFRWKDVSQANRIAVAEEAKVICRNLAGPCHDLNEAVGDNTPELWWLFKSWLDTAPATPSAS